MQYLLTVPSSAFVECHESALFCYSRDVEGNLATPKRPGLNVSVKYYLPFTSVTARISMLKGHFSKKHLSYFKAAQVFLFDLHIYLI